MSASLIAMMPAMMLPALAPAAVAVRRAGFVLGYLTVWTLVGLAVYAVAGAVMLGGSDVAAAVLTAAALYQLTPAKAACLRRCRDPRGTGLRHGARCVGCSAGLMASLFALDAMSLMWTALIAALIAAERLVPAPRVATYGIAAVLGALAVWAAAA